MKSYKIPIALILSLLLCFAANAAFASKAAELMAQAADQVSKAEKPHISTIDRQEAYDQAIKLYDEVDSKYSDTPESAEAIYQEALIYNTARDTKHHDQYMAYQKLNGLINIYDRPESVLSENLEKSEVSKIQKTVADAKALKARISDELDKQKSTTIQYKILDFFVALTGRSPGFSYWFAIVLITRDSQDDHQPADARTVQGDEGDAESRATHQGTTGEIQGRPEDHRREDDGALQRTQHQPVR